VEDFYCLFFKKVNEAGFNHNDVVFKTPTIWLSPAKSA